MDVRRLIIVILTIGLVAGAGFAFAQAAHPLSKAGCWARPPAQKPYLDGEMLVKFKDDVTADQIARLNAKNGCEVADVIQGLGIYRLRFNAGIDVPVMVERYQASGLVVFAEPNRRVSIPPMPGARPEALPRPLSSDAEIDP